MIVTNMFYETMRFSSLKKNIPSGVFVSVVCYIIHVFSMFIKIRRSHFMFSGINIFNNKRNNIFYVFIRSICKGKVFFGNQYISKVFQEEQRRFIKFYFSLQTCHGLYFLLQTKILLGLMLYPNLQGLSLLHYLSVTHEA